MRASASQIDQERRERGGRCEAVRARPWGRRGQGMHIFLHAESARLHVHVLCRACEVHTVCCACVCACIETTAVQRALQRAACNGPCLSRLQRQQPHRCADAHRAKALWPVEDLDARHPMLALEGGPAPAGGRSGVRTNGPASNYATLLVTPCTAERHALRLFLATRGSPESAHTAEALPWAYLLCTGGFLQATDGGAAALPGIRG